MPTSRALLAILQEFAARGINLTKLESRPTRQGLGDYCFLIDLEGHLSDEVVADCLRTLKTKQADVKFLGSYPAAGEHGPGRAQEVEAGGLTRRRLARRPPLGHRPHSLSAGGPAVGSSGHLEGWQSGRMRRS